ncbi:hypothetical protein GW17_00055516 [Ensete ventricosum]|nr:hypothetical protein GW17_00055516 [Ensete ventricosum]RZS19917.1 hypothetical protein BHM03_00052374 [Ensete ventricosum]
MKGHGRALLRRRRPGLALITVRQRHDVPGFAGAVQHHVVGEDVGVKSVTNRRTWRSISASSSSETPPNGTGKALSQHSLLKETEKAKRGKESRVGKTKENKDDVSLTAMAVVPSLGMTVIAKALDLPLFGHPPSFFRRTRPCDIPPVLVGYGRVVAKFMETTAYTSTWRTSATLPVPRSLGR